MSIIFHLVMLVVKACTGLWSGAGFMLRIIAGAHCFAIGDKAYRKTVMTRRLPLPIRSSSVIFLRKRVNRQRQVLMTICALFFMLSSTAHAATPPGTTISNIAEIRYAIGQTKIAIPTNKVENIIERSPSNLEFMIYNPNSSESGNLNVDTTQYDSTGSGTYISLPPPKNILGGVIDLDSDVPLSSTTSLRIGDAAFMRLTDLDANTNTTVVDTVVVVVSVNGTGETETLLLSETGPDTGVFTGYIQTTSSDASLASPNDGVLSVTMNSEITASYTDAGDGLDSSKANLLVDPYSVVFDSQTGNLVDGARISIYNVNTGELAIVYGTDGVSRYPSVLISGGDATDASGQYYDFPQGFYQFPLILPGNYYFTIEPPQGYSAPSAVDDATLQAVTPYNVNIISGSRGEVYSVPVGPPLRVDIPLDPMSEGLFLTKAVDAQSAEIGDFIRYSVSVYNNSNVIPSTSVTVVDTLPVGFTYQAGTSFIDDLEITDPQISADGREISYALADIPYAEKKTLTYVLQAGAGVQLGEAINSASAVSTTGLTSNTAQASINIVDPFLRNESTLIGSVHVSDCKDENSRNVANAVDDNELQMQGVEGIRFYMEDGTYVVSDEQGLFHFEGVQPGVHVVQLDLDSMPAGFEPILCGHSNRSSGRAYSQFVDLQNAALWRTDFFIAPIAAQVAEVSLQMSADFQSHVLDINIALDGGDLPLSKRSLTVMLADNSEYQKGSSRINGESIADPDVMQDMLIYRLPNVDQAWQETLTFKALQTDVSPSITTKALLSFNSPAEQTHRTPLSEVTVSQNVVMKKKLLSEYVYTPQFESSSSTLSKNDQSGLDAIVAQIDEIEDSRLFVVGHTGNPQLSARSRKILADNLALSQARVRKVGEYLTDQLGLSSEKISLVGLGEKEPREDDSNRVDISVVTEHAVFEQADNKLSVEGERQSLQVAGKTASLMNNSFVESKTKSGTITTELSMPAYDIVWLDAATSETEWLWPATNYSPAIPSISIAVKHAKDETLELSLNDAPVSALNFEGVTKSSDKSILISKWHGVDIVEGDNNLTMRVMAADGTVIKTLNHQVHYSRPPVRAEWQEAQSALKADGKSLLIVAVKLFDDEGHPARAGVTGSFKVEEPYQTMQARERLRNDVLANVAGQTDRFQVSENGIAYIELQPSMQTGNAILHFSLANGEETIQAWVEPGDRDWILVGVAEGTVGFNSLSGNMQSLTEQDADDETYMDGKIALFAKGKVAGKWLLTMAFDSTSKTAAEKEALFQTVDPDTYYTLYGDRAEQYYDAASQEKLYLKIERRQFYAMFGDYHTGLNITELSKYNRSFNGLKSELNTDRFGFNAFASEAGQGFVKEELRGDGTSGLYRLTNLPMINSEKISIEVRDRFRNEIVLEQRSLQAHLDYDIDYAAGTIYLREPLAASDFNFNPQFMVIDYETEDDNQGGINFGARAAVKMLGKLLEIGASVIHEDKLGAEGDLQGVDMQMNLANNIRIHAEAARTDKTRNGLQLEGNALLAEVSQNHKGLDLRAYYRKQEEGFGLGQQRLSGSGSEKVGVDANYRINNNFSASALGYKETVLATDAERDIAEARVNYQGKKVNGRLGLRQVDDKQRNSLNEFESSQSQQIVGAVETRLMDDRLRLHANQEYNFGDSPESQDFPNRTRFGVKYKITPKVDLLAEHEIARGDTSEQENTRLGLQATPWKGGSLTTGINQQFSENSERVFASAGLRQVLQFTDRWAFDIDLARNQSVTSDDRRPLNPASEPILGNEGGYTSASIGNSYRQDDWALTSRLEWRDSDTEKRWGSSVGVLGEPVKGIALSAKARYGEIKPVNGANKTEFDLRLGLARRPENGKLTILNRLDYATDDVYGGTLNSDSWSVTNNLSLNYRANANNQLSLMSGLKYKKQNLGQQNFDGVTSLLGAEWRYDFSERFDLGLHGSVLGSDSDNQSESSYGASLGFNPALNTWVSLGYNFDGYDNDDFSEAAYNAKGAFIRFRFKVDQNSLKDMLGRE